MIPHSVSPLAAAGAIADEDGEDGKALDETKPPREMISIEISLVRSRSDGSCKRDAIALAATRMAMVLSSNPKASLLMISVVSGGRVRLIMTNGTTEWLVNQEHNEHIINTTWMSNVSMNPLQWMNAHHDGIDDMNDADER